MSKTQKLIQKIEESSGSFVSFFSSGIFGSITKRSIKSLCRNRRAMDQLDSEIVNHSHESGVDVNQLYLLQYFYDMAQVRSLSYPSACTVTGKNNLFLRYMDWGVPDGLNKFIEEKQKIYNKVEYIDIGFPGFFGCITAIGRGWGMAMNQMPCCEFDYMGIPTTLYAKKMMHFLSYMSTSTKLSLRTIADRAIGYIDASLLNPISACAVYFYCSKRKESVCIQNHGDTWSVNKASVVANRFPSGSTINQQYDFPSDEDTSKEREKQARELINVSNLKQLTKVALSSKCPINNDATVYIVAADLSTGDYVIIK